MWKLMIFDATRRSLDVVELHRLSYSYRLESVSDTAFAGSGMCAYAGHPASLADRYVGAEGLIQKWLPTRGDKLDRLGLRVLHTSSQCPHLLTRQYVNSRHYNNTILYSNLSLNDCPRALHPLRSRLLHPLRVIIGLLTQELNLQLELFLRHAKPMFTESLIHKPQVPFPSLAH